MTREWAFEIADRGRAFGLKKGGICTVSKFSKPGMGDVRRARSEHGKVTRCAKELLPRTASKQLQRHPISFVSLGDPSACWGP